MRGIEVEGYRFSYMRNIPCENGISLLLLQTGIFIYESAAFVISNWQNLGGQFWVVLKAAEHTYLLIDIISLWRIVKFDSRNKASILDAK